MKIQVKQGGGTIKVLFLPHGLVCITQMYLDESHTAR